MSDLPPTAPEPVGARELRRSRAVRRAAIALVALVVLAGAVGLFGIRTRTLTATGGGYTLSVAYPWTDRSDQPIHWVITIRRPGGFTRKVNLAVEQTYLDLLDLNDIEPSPVGTTTRGSFVVWTFDPPPGDVLRVSIDGNIQLNAHFGAGNEVALLEGGRPVLSVSYRTWVAP